MGILQVLSKKTLVHVDSGKMSGLQAQGSSGLDIGYVPAGPHVFLRLSGQFGPPQFIFHWPEGPVFFFF